MSLSSSRRSSKMREDGEFYLECKAAFLTEYDDISDKIESRNKLVSLLQTTGRNPTRATLNKYWSSSTSSMSFNDFVDICNKEPVTTADDLMKAFRRIDINGDGYISFDELYKIMNKKGESMSRDEVRRMIDEVDDNKDGRLDYREFTNMVMKTTEDSKKMSKKMMERKERKKKRGELSAAQSDTNNIPDPQNTKEILKSGSQISVQSMKKESDREDSALSHTELIQNVAKNDLSGSRLSLRSGRRETVPSNKDTSYQNKQGSSLSLQKENNEMMKSSTVSLQSETQTKMEGDVQSSKVSLRETAEPDKVTESKVSIRSAVKESKMGSRASLRKVSEQGLELPLAQERQETLDVKYETSDRRGSASSQRSQTSKQEELLVQSATQNQLNTWNQTTKTSKSSGPSMSETGTSLTNEQGKTSVNMSTKAGNIKSEKSEISTSFARTEISRNITKENSKDSTLSKSERPKKMDSGMSPVIRTPRSRLAIPSIKELERPGTSYRRRETSESEKSVKNPEMTMSEIHQDGLNNMANTLAQDSARSVGEELDYDDDHDIMSTGRPTPRVSLSSRTDTSKADSPKSARNGLPKQEEDAKRGEKDDTETGSQSSLRSGDKEAGVPVPSPRKSVKGVTEDEVPRPSPRVRNSKTKSPSSSLRSKEKLPDPRSLQDWKNFTSKGCFFYEEDEIVSHVYSLRLQDDSTVYLSAAPINEPACLNLPGSEPIDTALFVLDSKGNVVAFTEQRDVQGTFGVKVDLEAGDYQIVPYTTGCRFKHRSEMSLHMKEARLVKKDKDDKILITTAFRKALEDIFELCDLDGNGTMSRDEFNWFNVRTSGEELGDDEWDVVEEKTDLENGEITRAGFIKLNEMEAEDAEGDVEDLWITLTSMGMNKSLMMDEACPYRLNVYVKDVRRKQPRLTVTGIESLEKREFVSGICQFLIEKAGEPTSIRKMKDLYLYTYKNDYSATMVIDNRSRSTVQLEIDCSKSRNVVSNRSGLDHTFEIDPQQTAIAHHLMPKSELSDWSVVSTETIHK